MRVGSAARLGRRAVYFHDEKHGREDTRTVSLVPRQSDPWTWLDKRRRTLSRAYSAVAPGEELPRSWGSSDGVGRGGFGTERGFFGAEGLLGGLLCSRVLMHIKFRDLESSVPSEPPSAICRKAGGWEGLVHSLRG